MHKIYLTGIPEEKKKGMELIFDVTVTENFPQN